MTLQLRIPRLLSQAFRQAIRPFEHVHFAFAMRDLADKIEKTAPSEFDPAHQPYINMRALKQRHWLRIEIGVRDTTESGAPTKSKFIDVNYHSNPAKAVYSIGQIIPGEGIGFYDSGVMTAAKLLTTVTNEFAAMLHHDDIALLRAYVAQAKETQHPKSPVDRVKKVFAQPTLYVGA